MPAPLALPLLGAAARLILSSGAREAAKKYGRVAIKKAQEQIKKHDSALTKKSIEAARKEGLGTLPRRAGKAARQEAEKQSQRDMLRTRLDRQRAQGRTPTIKDEVPLRFAKGGSIDGKATRGLTKGSRRK
jgi:hypothetical protein|tara:strand:+ start:991 stop:1383 length:393 start_codon:yes stop_codon:yes gene_type:complete